MGDQRRAGTIYFKVDGTIQDAKGAFTYNLGKPKREAIIGADGVHGYKEVPQVAFIEGEITDRKELDLATLVQAKDALVTLDLANGKTIALRNAWYAGDGNVQTDESAVKIRFEGLSAEEIT